MAIVWDAERAHEIEEEAAEASALELHDEQHKGDPALYWDECVICQERVEEDQAEGLRCGHGLLAGECNRCAVAMELMGNGI